MAKYSHQLETRGPFSADQLRPGDPYELSNGHPVLCLPTGSRGGRATNVGGGVLASDPAVEDVGVDVGFSPSPSVLRAPDLSVGALPDQPGWVEGAPLLAVEYADTGQDEAELQAKIQELFAAGTRFIWVVRMIGPRRVEVYQPGERLRIANPGEQLVAPGILANPVPVEALYDREAARRVTFRNLLERQGYKSLDEVRAEGEALGRSQGEVLGRTEGEALGRIEGEVLALRRAIVAVLEGRGLTAGDELQAVLSSSNESAVLESALRRATTGTVADVLAVLQP